MKKVPVKKGDFFFIESGTLHAICKGILLAEVQQNSDTTYRIYDYGRLGLDGKPRELHVEDAVNVTHTGVYKNPCVPEKDGNVTKLVSCPFFTERVIDIDGSFEGDADEKSFVSLLILDGSGTLECAGETLEFSKGGSIFIPAGCGSYKINGEARALETRV